jgi:hypothetical protein
MSTNYILDYIVFIALCVTFLISLTYFIYTSIYYQDKIQSWQMPLLLALIVDQILYMK